MSTKPPGQGFARQITLGNLDKVAPLLIPRSAGNTDGATDQNATTKTPRAPNPAFDDAEAMFSGEHIKSKRPALVQSQTQAPAPPALPPSLPPSPGAQMQPVAPTTVSGPAVKGALAWTKILSQTDAQLQQGNVTGDLRLTQARFMVGGSVIDQTTYFRNTVFGGFQWQQTTNPQGKLVEVADVEFDLTISGTHIGRRTLTVSHKPTGEAGQSNYTTNIRWGAWLSVIQSANVTGRTLHLYAPPVGHQQPFVIEIV